MIVRGEESPESRHPTKLYCEESNRLSVPSLYIVETKTREPSDARLGSGRVRRSLGPVDQKTKMMPRVAKQQLAGRIGGD